MNLPNKLTMLRMILIPVFIVFVFLEFFDGIRLCNDFIATVIFVVASYTDYLDGHLARKNNMVTDFGKLFDPAADKLLCCSALICIIYRFALLGFNTALFVMSILFTVFSLIIIARELFITAFRSIAAKKNIVMAADMPGKLKTVAQMCAIIGLFLALDFLNINEIVFYIFLYAGAVMLAAGTVLAVISCILYLIKYKEVFI